jgi:hypothetical protein
VLLKYGETCAILDGTGVGTYSLQGARRARERQAVISGDRATVSVSVAVTQATAFDVFTREMDLWWGELMTGLREFIDRQG